MPPATRAVPVAALALTLTPCSAGPPDTTQTTKLLNPFPAASDQFGNAVAIDGSLIVVGVRWDNQGATDAGTAVVHRDVAGVWSMEQVLVAGDGAANDWFGASVAVSREVIVVGAPQNDSFGTNGGAAYVFRFNKALEVWQQEDKIGPLVGPTGNYFGNSVAIDGDVIAVGAYQDNLPLPTAGSVHVYRLQDGRWALDAEIQPAGLDAGDQFGTAVALQGDLLLASAESDDGPGNMFSGAGAAYVYRYAGGTWMLEQKLEPPGHPAAAQFGVTLALDGALALFGAWRDDDGGTDAGAAYVFRQVAGPGTWQFEQKLLAFQPQAGAHLGLGVAIHGDLAVCGAYRENAPIDDSGAAYVHRDTGRGWVPLARLLPSDPEVEGFFGNSVAIQSGVAVVGSFGDNTPLVDSGSAYVYSLFDCNGNGVPDANDISMGHSLDGNDDDVPDECEADCDHNGALDAGELIANPALDYDLDGILDQCFPVMAQEMLWNAGGGTFRDHVNWDPGTPFADDTAIFAPAASVTATLDIDAPLHQLRIDDGQVMLADEGDCVAMALGSLDPQGALVIGTVAGRSPILMLTGCLDAAAQIGGVTRLATAPGTSATLILAGPEVSLFAGQDMCIGCQGSGTMILSAGAHANVLIATVGGPPAGSGAVLVGGAGSRWDVAFFLVLANGLLDVAAGGEVAVGPGGILVLPGGMITGQGTILGDVTSVGSIAPGGSPGMLVVEGDYEQSGMLIPPFGSASGSLHVEIAGVVPGLEHDVLAVGGQASLGGGLFVTLLDGFAPALGQGFAILDAVSVNPGRPRFDVAFFPGLSGGQAYLRAVYGSGGAAGSGAVTVEVAQLLQGVAFGAPAGTVVPGQPSDAAAGDLDGDGFPDLAIAIPAAPGEPGSVVVLLGDGTGGFVSSQEITVGNGPSAIALGLLDGDTLLDIAVAHAEDGDVAVLLNLGAGTFPPDNPAAHVPVGAGPAGVAAANLHDAAGNLPGLVDLVVASAGSGTLTVLANAGNGTFVPLGPPTPAGTQPVAVNPLDVDNDKDLDLAVADFAAGALLVFAGQDGVFAAPLAIPVGAQPGAIAPAAILRGQSGFDLDLNGFADLVTANGDGTVSVVLNEGNLDFAPAVNLPLGTPAISIAALDMEQDGDVDLAVVVADGQEGAALVALRNDLNPLQGGQQLAFVEPQDLGADPGTILVLEGDIDADGDDDLVALTGGAFGAASGAGGAGGAGAGLGLPAVEVVPNLLVTPAAVPGDANGDGTVDVADLVAVVLAWGPCPPICPPACPADVNDDCAVDVGDLVTVVLNWG
jgi:hypothetical protein